MFHYDSRWGEKFSNIDRDSQCMSATSSGSSMGKANVQQPMTYGSHDDSDCKKKRATAASLFVDNIKF